MFKLFRTANKPILTTHAHAHAHGHLYMLLVSTNLDVHTLNLCFDLLTHNTASYTGILWKLAPCVI